VPDSYGEALYSASPERSGATIFEKKGSKQFQSTQLFFTCSQDSLEKEKGGFVISNSAKKN
jgi:hypothetical protein